MRNLLLCLLLGLMACQPRASVQEAVAPPPPPRERVAELLFAGDVMVHTPQLTAAKIGSGYDFKPSFAYLKPLFEEADLAVVNLETTLAKRPPYTGYPLFRSPYALVDALSDAGVDVALMANNHAMDCGAAGVRATLSALESWRIRPTGVWRSKEEHQAEPFLLVTIDSIRFAIANYTYGTNGMPVPQGMHINRLDTVQMAADIARMQLSEADCIIVCLHWGIEYELKPNRAQRRLADFLRRQGVQLIIGSHPHVVQPFEADSLSACFYSLGNLVSNQRKRYTDGGILARIRVTQRGDEQPRIEAEAIPCWVDKWHGYRVLPLAAADTLTHDAAYKTFREDVLKTLQKGL